MKTNKELTEDEGRQQHTTDDSDESNSTRTGCDQDSDVPFQSGPDDDMDTGEVGEEDCIEDIERSTEDAEDKMRAANKLCWT